MSVYRYSEFAHSVPLDPGKTALFNSLTLGLVVVPNDLLQFIPVSHTNIYGEDNVRSLLLNEGGAELLSCLQRQKILLPIQRRTDSEDYCAINQALSEPVFGLIYLLGGHLKSGHVWSLENRP